jgi:hypothetical protein
MFVRTLRFWRSTNLVETSFGSGGSLPSFHVTKSSTKGQAILTVNLCEIHMNTNNVAGRLSLLDRTFALGCTIDIA